MELKDKVREAVTVVRICHNEPNVIEATTTRIMEVIKEEEAKDKKGKVKIENREFEGNVMVTISEKEVRVWVCNKEGANIFRFKALGKVYKGQQDITIIGSEYGKE